MLKPEKFKDPFVTSKGQTRASVKLKNLEVLWFNTGTLCNLSCSNCYIESSPTNDQLSYISLEDVVPYLVEIKSLNLGTKQIAFTGGEPFLNPDMVAIIEKCLVEGFEVLVLTNAYRAIDRLKDKLLSLHKKFPDKLILRISIDHYTQEVHEKERGEGTFFRTLSMMKWLSDNDFRLAIAGRSLTDEHLESAKRGYINLLKDNQINLDYSDPASLVIFPEMDINIDVPEITTDCWGILDKSPDEMMCAYSRMIVKRKGEQRTKILACTLLAYDEQFELGHELEQAQQSVQLNHPHCAKFCVLGGASCS